MSFKITTLHKGETISIVEAMAPVRHCPTCACAGNNLRSQVSEVIDTVVVEHPPKQSIKLLGPLGSLAAKS